MFKIGKSASTGTLINHLKRHTKEFREFSLERNLKDSKKEENAGKQPTLSEVFQKKETFTTSHPRHIQITKSVVEMMATDLHSYSLVQEKSFKNLLQVLEPRYKLPSRTTFSQSLVPALYASEKKKLQVLLENELSNVPSLSLTTDTWTSRSNDSFLCLTAHYLTKDFDNRSFVLGNKNKGVSHSRLFIGQLEEIVEEWKLPKMPIFVVSDNGANIKAALERSSWERVSCFAHSLQLAIHDAESDVPGVNEMCKRA